MKITMPARRESPESIVPWSIGSAGNVAGTRTTCTFNPARSAIGPRCFSSNPLLDRLARAQLHQGGPPPHPRLSR